MNSAMKARSILAALFLATTAAGGAMAQDKVSVTTEAAVAATEVPADAVVVNIDKLKYETPDLTVKVGDLVRAGQEVAKAGSTGRSTGAHVHFEVWENGSVVNPRKFLGDNRAPVARRSRG